MKVAVFFETKVGSHIVAQFDEESTYMACLPALEKLAKSQGYIVTESMDYEDPKQIEIDMKSYKVTACYYTYCTAEIEAEDGDQAYDIASSMDGGSFSSTEKGGWQILDIEEVTDGE